jgi:hypothetical protein
VSGSISDFPAYLGAIEKVSAGVGFEVKEDDLLVDIARLMTELKLNQSIQSGERSSGDASSAPTNGRRNSTLTFAARRGVRDSRE